MYLYMHDLYTWRHLWPKSIMIIIFIIKELQSSLLGKLNLVKGTPRTTSKIAFIGLGSLFCEDTGIQLL